MLEIDLGTIMKNFKIFGPLYFLSNYLELFDSIFLLLSYGKIVVALKTCFLENSYIPKYDNKLCKKYKKK